MQELTKSTWSCFTLQLIAESERVRNDQVNLVVYWAYDIRQMRRGTYQQAVARRRAELRALPKYRKISKLTKNDFSHVLFSRAQVIWTVWLIDRRILVTHSHWLNLTVFDWCTCVRDGWTDDSIYAIHAYMLSRVNCPCDRQTNRRTDNGCRWWHIARSAYMLLSVEIYDWLYSTVFWLIYPCYGRTDREMDGRTTAYGALAHGRRAMKTEEQKDWLTDGRIDG